MEQFCELSANVEKVSIAYKVLLELPLGSIERHKLEPVLCTLRDFIAESTGAPAEYVQDLLRVLG